jgi:LPS O-antigen subunit length determinant protein (WzzB/FepE family)
MAVRLYVLIKTDFDPFSLFILAKATYAAIGATYAYLTPDLWKETVFTKSPYQEFTDYLAKNHRAVTSQRQETKQY